MVLMRQRRTEQGHDPVTHYLIHCAFITMHSFHHVFEDWVKEFPRFLRITVSKQLHRSFHIGEEHRDLLALAFESALRRKDLLGEVFGGISFGGNEARCYGGLRAHRLPTLKTELCSGRKLRAAHSALEDESSSALQTKFCLGRILLVAARTPHNESKALRSVEYSDSDGTDWSGHI